MTLSTPNDAQIQFDGNGTVVAIARASRSRAENKSNDNSYRTSLSNAVPFAQLPAYRTVDALNVFRSRKDTSRHNGPPQTDDL